MGSRCGTSIQTDSGLCAYFNTTINLSWCLRLNAKCRTSSNSLLHNSLTQCVMWCKRHLTRTLMSLLVWRAEVFEQTACGWTSSRSSSCFVDWSPAPWSQHHLRYRIQFMLLDSKENNHKCQCVTFMLGLRGAPWTACMLDAVYLGNKEGAAPPASVTIWTWKEVVCVLTQCVDSS